MFEFYRHRTCPAAVIHNPEFIHRGGRATQLVFESSAVKALPATSGRFDRAGRVQILSSGMTEVTALITASQSMRAAGWFVVHAA
jgi:hypothetical protein